MKTHIGAGANRLIRVGRDHPIALGMIGVGVTWLVIERARRRSIEVEEWGTDELEDYGDVAAPTAGQAADRVSEKASRAARRVSDAASEASRKVGEAAGHVKDRAVDLGLRTTEQAHRVRESFWDLVDRRPLATGLATLGAGVIVGLLIPPTRREDELMGETRDELLRGAREAGKRTLEKTKDVARTAADAAREAAESEAERQDLGLH